jgi:hypothetical protein
MRKLLILIVSLLFFSLTDGVLVVADREAPKKVDPVIFNDIKIVAENKSPETMSVVTAIDIKTNKLLWSKEVYKVRMNSFVETDTQWVFIKELRIEEDKLIVINEKQKKFVLDPYTGEKLGMSDAIKIWGGIGIFAISLALVYAYKYKKRKTG